MTERYIPKYSVPISSISEPRIMLAIQGPGGSGKTTSALTFPNPIIAAFEPGFEEHKHRTDITIVPFYSPEFVRDLGEKDKFKPTSPASDAQVNRKDAFIWWLKNEGLKIPVGNTFILDAWTSMQRGFDQQETQTPTKSKKGNVNEYTFWENKITYSEDVISYLASMKCNVVCLFHEVQQRDKQTGQLLEKIQPLMQGGFTPKIKICFPYFYRMISKKEKDKDGKEIGCDFFWQIKSSNAFDAKTGLTVPDDVFEVEPNHNVFVKYRKTIIV